MPTYADPTRVKERSAVSAADLALTDRDADADADEDDLDLLIGELNELASETVDEYCQRTFTETTETITIDGNGHDSLRLPGYPVSDVSSVKVGGDALDAADYRIKGDSPAHPGDNAGILERKSGVFPERWNAVEVTYTWGYSTPPGDVRDVAETLVVDALRAASGNTRARGDGVSSISMDGFSVTFDAELSATMSLTPEQKEQLDKHKRVIVA